MQLTRVTYLLRQRGSKMRRPFVVLCWSMVGLCIGQGCGETGPVAAQLELPGDVVQGALRVSSWSVSSGLVGDYLHPDGTRLAFATERVAVPQGAWARPDGRNYETTARLVDACGGLIAHVSEGHPRLPPAPAAPCDADMRPLELLESLARALTSRDIVADLRGDLDLLLGAIDDTQYALRKIRQINGGADVHSAAARHGAVNALKTHVANWEFKHRIELWSQQYRRPIDGKRTVNHHSGSYDIVMKRRLHSNDPWQLQEGGRNCNHGACPWTEEMQQYAVCENDTPVTHEVFAAHSDCNGFWGLNHLCNDDTALQINQAYGRGLGVTSCKSTHRANRPWCGVQW